MKFQSDTYTIIATLPFGKSNRVMLWKLLLGCESSKELFYCRSMPVVLDETDSDGTFLFFDHHGAKHYTLDEGVNCKRLNFRAFKTIMFQIVQHDVSCSIQE